MVTADTLETQIERRTRNLRDLEAHIKNLQAAAAREESDLRILEQAWVISQDPADETVEASPPLPVGTPVASVVPVAPVVAPTTTDVTLETTPADVDRLSVPALIVRAVESAGIWQRETEILSTLSTWGRPTDLHRLRPQLSLAVTGGLLVRRAINEPHTRGRPPSCYGLPVWATGPLPAKFGAERHTPNLVELAEQALTDAGVPMLLKDLQRAIALEGRPVDGHTLTSAVTSAAKRETSVLHFITDKPPLIGLQRWARLQRVHERSIDIVELPIPHEIRSSKVLVSCWEVLYRHNSPMHWAEIAAKIPHPISKKSVQQLLSGQQAKSVFERVDAGVYGLRRWPNEGPLGAPPIANSL